MKTSITYIAVFMFELCLKDIDALLFPKCRTFTLLKNDITKNIPPNRSLSSSVLHAIVRGSLLDESNLMSPISQTQGSLTNTNQIQSSKKGLSRTKVDDTLNWSEKLLQISNAASLLCAIDCTVLPIVTLLLPLIGIGVSPTSASFLHDLGHAIGIYFVLPVGSFATAMNFRAHKNTFISSFAALGLFLIYLANGSGGPILSLLPDATRHALHCGGLAHRLCNIAGSLLLFGSNLVSRQPIAYGVNSFQEDLPSPKEIGTFLGVQFVGFCCNMPGCKHIFRKKDENDIFFSWKVKGYNQNIKTINQNDEF